MQFSSTKTKKNALIKLFFAILHFDFLPLGENFWRENRNSLGTLVSLFLYIYRKSRIARNKIKKNFFFKWIIVNIFCINFFLWKIIFTVLLKYSQIFILSDNNNNNIENVWKKHKRKLIILSLNIGMRVCKGKFV